MANAPSAQATLLVDGYNIIGAWPRLQQVRDLASLEEARRALVEELASYSAYQAYSTQVIFDSQYQTNSSAREEITTFLSIYYTDFGQTADTYIERFCALYQRQTQPKRQRLIVATSDRAQQLTVIGYGAECMSALQLHHDLDATTRMVRSRQQQSRQKSTSKRSLLSHALDPVAQAKLHQLRFGSFPQKRDRTS